jgi:hypothetical protein
MAANFAAKLLVDNYLASEKDQGIKGDQVVGVMDGYLTSYVCTKCLKPFSPFSLISCWKQKNAYFMINDRKTG